MQKPKIGVGFVGLSARRGWAAQAHLPALRMLGDYEVRGLVGSSAESAAAASRKFEVPFSTGRVDELLARPDIDLVAVTVKVPEHYAVVRAALEAGKAVFCEWPLGRNSQEAEELAVLAARRQVPVFVGLQARLSPAVRYLRDLLDGGYVGEVLSTSLIAASGPPWGSSSIDAEEVLYQDRSNGATMVTVPFGHAYDAMCGLFGELGDVCTLLDVRMPFATRRDTGERIAVTAPDQLAVSGRFRSGPVASLHFRSGVQSGTRFHWEINGTRGDLIVEAPSGHLQFGRVSLRGAAAEAKTLTVLPIPAQYTALQGDSGNVAYNLAILYDAIANDMRTGTRTAPTFADAVALHRALDSIEAASARQAARIAM